LIKKLREERESKVLDDLPDLEDFTEILQFERKAGMQCLSQDIIDKYITNQ